METSGAVLDVRLPWTLDPLPNLELGHGEGPYQFYRIRGIVGLREGGTAVVDAGSQEVRWFDDSGGFLFRVGGDGEGPGEFRRPALIPQFHGDSLLIFDSFARRFTWLASDGSGFRVEGPPRGGGWVIAGQATVAGGRRVLFRTGSSGECLTEYCESQLNVRWVHPTEGLSDTLAAFPRRRAMITIMGGLPSSVSGPFDPTAAVAIGPAGPVVEGLAGYSLSQFDHGGRLIDIFRVGASVPTVSEEMIRDATELRAGQDPDASVVADAFARMDMPEVLPAFQSVIVDRVGWLWSELFRLDQSDPSLWLVFDSGGRAQGVMEIPAGLEIHEIGEDYVLGRWVDELGVEYVRRHSLERTGR